MFGELRPWLDMDKQADEFYKPLTRQLNSVQTLFNPHYESNFVRHFSDKTQYYKKLINNDLTAYCNAFITDAENATANRLAYKLDKSRKLLYSCIREAGNIINTQQFDLSQINNKNTDFSIDKPYKESTYIVFYLLSALIKCSMEIQYHFRDAIHKDNLMEISDFYTQLLLRQAPDNPCIKEIQTLEFESVAEEKTKKKHDKTAVLAFTYKKLNAQSGNITDLFNALKKNNRIAQDTSITDFKHTFSGVAVENPIRWTGAKSELPYLIKLLCNTHKVLDYSGSIWQIVCACFVDKDGNPYEESNLKDQKKPKQTAATIEKIANLMK
jgi:hypothetical protein